MVNSHPTDPSTAISHQEQGRTEDGETTSKGDWKDTRTGAKSEESIPVSTKQQDIAQHHKGYHLPEHHHHTQNTGNYPQRDGGIRRRSTGNQTGWPAGGRDRRRTTTRETAQPEKIQLLNELDPKPETDYSDRNPFKQPRIILTRYHHAYN
ncbi:hypothetical protein PSTG_19178 [Puccinia striiformis f. sp. tritici PST-78]|uniref:Uncharacterized protein n=1 Tax=Puccinia striiformis f. sp. tritici PST-78 TaxID=1165861 RepID=A0A0L0UK35_9BASI|nr:hypothetical protein PSTG_19178 [Puccinia striiformis f. sp. tritici PST-78]